MVHIAAIARTSLVLAHAEADNAYDERLRLRAETERLQGEVALLKEEIRIKDARMERLDPQRESGMTSRWTATVGIRSETEVWLPKADAVRTRGRAKEVSRRLTGDAPRRRR
jgi:hypothetical protein